MASDQAALQRTNVLLGPRDTAGCLDGAVQICGRYLPVILPLWLIAAVPTGLVVSLLTGLYGFDLRAGLVVVYVASIPLGYLLIEGVAPLTFGQRWQLAGTLESVTWRSATPLLQALGSRSLLAIGPGLVLFGSSPLWIMIGCGLSLFPGCWLLIRGGFIFEKSALSRLGEHLHSRNTRKLIRQHFSTLLTRAIWMQAYCGLILAVLLVSAEVLLSLCLDFSFFGPITAELGHALTFNATSGPLDLIWDYLLHSPLVSAWLCVSILLVYVIGRLAWFLSYIDLRVRYDCWDMELQMFEQALRLRQGR